MRYSDLIYGDIVFTGNTLGLSRGIYPRQPGRECIAGAFIASDGGVCGAFPPQTTCNFIENQSEALLRLPSGAEVVYAELIWGGTSRTEAGSVESNIDDSILFTVAGDVAAEIAPDPATRFEGQMVSGTNVFTYTRSADVTALVKNAGAGTYSVGRVPAFLDGSDSTSRQSGCVGWTLAVAYRLNEQESAAKTIALYVGSLAAKQYEEPVSYAFTGFLTPEPPAGARLLLSAAEGDYILKGDQIFFSTPGNVLADVPLSGPNNPANNFFASQINDSKGELDTAGSFGDRNHLRATSSGDIFYGTSAGRQGWDITNVDISGHLDGARDSAVLKISTVGDSILLNAVALSMDMRLSPPAIVIIKSVDRSYAIEGNVIDYSIEVRNSGGTDLSTIIIKDVLPRGLSLLPGTITLDGKPYSGSFEEGIQVPQIRVGASCVIGYQVMLNARLARQGEVLLNKAIAAGVCSVCGRRVEDSTSADIDVVMGNIEKQTDISTARFGDIVHYKITFTNNSSLDMENVKIIDTIPQGASLIQGSIRPAPALEETLQTGIYLGRVAAGAQVTLEYSVMINSVIQDKIVNTASAAFSFRDTRGNIQSGSTQPVVKVVTIAREVDWVVPCIDAYYLNWLMSMASSAGYCKEQPLEQSVCMANF